jgi:hypothetical protein
MTLHYVNSFIAAINEMGSHSSASAFFGIECNEFDVFCGHELFSPTENYQMLENATDGCFLYTNYNRDNPDFVQSFHNYLGVRIEIEINIVSDIFNNTPINFMAVKIAEDEYRLIYELHSSCRLQLLR